MADILSSHPDAKLFYIANGVVFKCNSAVGLCWETKDKVEVNYKWILPRELKPIKPRAKFHLIYIASHYKMEHGGGFTRTEYYLPNGDLIYTNDCSEGHGGCNRREMNTVIDLFKEYSQQYRIKKVMSSQIKRKTSKKGCGCK